MSLLKVRELRTYFFTRRGIIKAVDGASFELKEGETLCIVGESGSGKTVTALSILRLVDLPGRIVGGEVIFNNEDLLKASDERLRRIRGKEIAMIFQDPKASLNPVFTVGEQISEAIRLHLKADKKEAEERAISLMKEVGIPNAEERYSWYPHQFSGGMNQRAMIAMALSCSPKILIADEPTSNLDVTVQAQILELLKGLKKTIIFITHDLGIVAEIADRVAVMQDGRVVEQGDKFEIFDRPKHPYTSSLLGAVRALYEGAF